jgi:moderate conductance mechanosensitive channel
MPPGAMLAVVQGAVEPQVAACGPKGQQTWLCSTVFRITDSKDAAEVADALAKPLRVVLILVIAWIVARVLRRIIHRVGRRLGSEARVSTMRTRVGFPALAGFARQRREQRIQTLTTVLANVVSVTVWVIAIVMVIDALGVNVAPVIAGASIATIVIAFGAQTIVRDYLAGLLMIIEDQYGVGDMIDTGVASGTVEEVSLRVTRLRDTDGVVWYVPNGEIKRVGNSSQRDAPSPPVASPGGAADEEA